MLEGRILWFVVVLTEEPFVVNDEPVTLEDAAYLVAKIDDSVPFLLVPCGHPLLSSLSLSV